METHIQRRSEEGERWLKEEENFLFCDEDLPQRTVAVVMETH